MWIFYFPHNCWMYTHMCNKTGCCFLIFTSIVGKYWIDSGFSGNAIEDFSSSFFFSLSFSVCNACSWTWTAKLSRKGESNEDNHEEDLLLRGCLFLCKGGKGSKPPKGCCLVAFKHIITTRGRITVSRGDWWFHPVDRVKFPIGKATICNLSPLSVLGILPSHLVDISLIQSGEWVRAVA